MDRSGRKTRSTGEASGTMNLPFVLFLTATASLGGMLFGFDLGIIAGAGPFLKQEFYLNDLQLGWAYSSLLFGCVAGSLLAGRMTDAYGRRRLLLVVAMLFLLTSVATGLAPAFALVVLARLAGGLAVGAVSVASPIYIAEVAPPRVRGRMGAAYQMSITVGILVAYGLDFVLRNSGAWNWRWMFMTGAVPSLAFLIALVAAPETPRYLFRSGRRGEAAALLGRIMGPKAAAREMAAIVADQFENESVPRGSSSLLNSTLPRRVLMFSVVLAILVQATGINTVIDYAPIVFGSVGWKMDAALFSTFAIGGVNFLFTLISFWTIDRYGRRPLYLVGSAGMGVTMALIAVVVSHKGGEGELLLGLMTVFIAFFASCIGPVFWTLLPEIFPNRLRARLMVVPVVVQWVANAAVVLVFPLAFHSLGRAPTFLFLACMSAVQAWFAWRYLPETKGRSLEEMEDFWRRSDYRNTAKELGA